MHIMFQFIMGWYLYEAENTTDPSKKKSCQIKAFLVPFLIHGLWDTLQFDTGVFIVGEMTVTSIVALVIMLAVTISAIVGEVRMAVYLKKMEV